MSNCSQKLLSNRLTHLIPDIIHPDQVGFVLSREAKDNVTRTLDVIHAAKTSHVPLMLLSTDAEKAFDRKRWPFRKAVLQHIGLRSENDALD